MKKLLIFILVIAIAPVANAGISLSVNGAPAPGTIYLNGPSSTITLDILMDEPQFAGGDIAVVLSNSQGALDYSGMTFKDPVMTRAFFAMPPRCRTQRRRISRALTSPGIHWVRTYLPTT